MYALRRRSVSQRKSTDAKGAHKITGEIDPWQRRGGHRSKSRVCPLKARNNQSARRFKVLAYLWVQFDAEKQLVNNRLFKLDDSFCKFTL